MTNDTLIALHAVVNQVASLKKALPTYHIPVNTKLWRYHVDDELWYSFITQKPVTYDLKTDMVFEYQPSMRHQAFMCPTPVMLFLNHKVGFIESWLFFRIPDLIYPFIAANGAAVQRA